MKFTDAEKTEVTATGKRHDCTSESLGIGCTKMEEIKIIR